MITEDYYTELINRLEDVKDAIKKQNYGIAMDILYKPYPGYQITTLAEFQEGEDERIRQFLIHEVIETSDKIMSYRNMSKKDVLAWLEKQGEQKKKVKVGEKYKCIEPPVYTCFMKGEIYEVKSSFVASLINICSDCFELVTDDHKPAEWEPQTGDTFRKKGTTSPTYHLCYKREDGITFSFVENCEVGISGGEITIFALRNYYELVERQKSIEDVVEKELNKVSQTKVGQKPAWSEEDEDISSAIIKCLRGSDTLSVDLQSAICWIENVKDRV